MDEEKQGQDQVQDQVQDVRELVLVAIVDGERDAEHCLALRSRLKEPVMKEILRQIRLDHLKHVEYLREIYEKMTGIEAVVEKASLLPAVALEEEWENGIFRALNQVEFLRQIAFSFADQETRDILLEIITDKQAHAIKLEHLYNKSRG